MPHTSSSSSSGAAWGRGGGCKLLERGGAADFRERMIERLKPRKPMISGSLKVNFLRPLGVSTVGTPGLAPRSILSIRCAFVLSSADCCDDALLHHRMFVPRRAGGNEFSATGFERTNFLRFFPLPSSFGGCSRDWSTLLDGIWVSGGSRALWLWTACENSRFFLSGLVFGGACAEKWLGVLVLRRERRGVRRSGRRATLKFVVCTSDLQLILIRFFSIKVLECTYGVYMTRDYATYKVSYIRQSINITTLQRYTDL